MMSLADLRLLGEKRKSGSDPAKMLGRTDMAIYVDSMEEV